MFPEFSPFSAEFPWMESRLAMWPANGTENNNQSSVKQQQKKPTEALKTFTEH